MKMQMRLAVFVFCVAVPTPAQALLCGTFLSPVQVTATTLSFGTYNPAAPGNDTANATVTIECQLLNLDVLPSFTVELSGGVSGNFAPREMSFASSILEYNIYTTSGFANVWGDSTHGVTQSHNTTLMLDEVQFTAYGRILTGQFVPAGTYHDTITVTVTW